MGDFLDNLIGEQGVKTDVQISLPPSAYIYLGAALFIGIVASQIVVKAIVK
jgi:hypothetical protein